MCFTFADSGESVPVMKSTLSADAAVFIPKFAAPYTAESDQQVCIPLTCGFLCNLLLSPINLNVMKMQPMISIFLSFYKIWPFK